MKALPVTGVCIVVFVAALLRAEEVPSFPAPQKEHEWLKQFEGAWETDMEANIAPGEPPVKCHGTISARMLGGFWVVSDVNNEIGGIPFVAVQTIGYDPAKKKYIGTWVDSMISHLWNYEGTLDKTGKILTLEAEGPNFMKAGQLAKFRDVYEFKSKDHLVTASLMQAEDGKWITFATGNAKRKK